MGLVLISPERITIEKSLRLNFSATNNEAEYEALLEGMSMVQKLGEKAVDMFSVLAIRGPEAVQMILFRTILALHAP